jgi:hypothetical protein
MLEVPSKKLVDMAPSTTSQNRDNKQECTTVLLPSFESTPVTTCKQFIHIISTIAAHQFTRSFIITGIPDTACKMQRSANNETPPSTKPEQCGFKSKASRYFYRTPSLASFKSAPARTETSTTSCGVGDTSEKGGPIHKARRSVSLLAAKLSFFKREAAIT